MSIQTINQIIEIMNTTGQPITVSVGRFCLSPVMSKKHKGRLTFKVELV